MSRSSSFDSLTFLAKHRFIPVSRSCEVFVREVVIKKYCLFLKKLTSSGLRWLYLRARPMRTMRTIRLLPHSRVGVYMKLSDAQDASNALADADDG